MTICVKLFPNFDKIVFNVSPITKKEKKKLVNFSGGQPRFSTDQNNFSSLGKGSSKNYLLFPSFFSKSA